MNKKKHINMGILFIIGAFILAGCSAGREKKYSLEDLDNLAEIRIYSAENDELIQTINDEELLYQYNQFALIDDSFTEEQQGELKEGATGAREKYRFVSYKYPVAQFGNKEAKENTTIILYEDSNIIKMILSEESIKAFTVPTEFLTFYSEISEEELNFYYSLIE